MSPPAMSNQATEERAPFDLPWLVAGSFIVLLAGFAFVLLTILFFAGADDIRFLGDVAGFVLIFACVTFGVLLFVASTDPEAGDIEASEPESGLAAPPGACPSCRQVNPEAANFCYHCGSSLRPRS
jgi:hypothetical protein